MLDTKYAVKYKMPHTLLHIVDNSAYTAPLPLDVAEDPSLYASIVVTATPMGVDNKLVNLTRADIASASFGLGNITADDIAKFGQSVEYPLSLIQNAKAPVMLLRVTPEGSSYAFVTLLVQWRFEEDRKRFVVRYKESTTPPEGLRLDRFKNTDKLNAEIIKRTPTTTEIDGVKWNQAVFMNIISAGRGKIYNDFSFAINFGKQAKMPSNCRYIFSTINTQSGMVVEEFTASLSNITTASSNKYLTTIDDVNTVVNQRYEGSSILIPYLNQAAVKAVFTAYTNKMAAYEQSGELTDQEITELKTLNINIFDMVYGNYIYEGSQYDVKLPRYYVDMFDTNIKQLPEKDRFTMFISADDEYDTLKPTQIWNHLYPITSGVLDDTSKIYIGSTYAYSVYANTEPTIDVIASINQYTGAITSVSYTDVWVKNVDASEGNRFVTATLKAFIQNVNLDSSLYNDAGNNTYVLLKVKPDDWNTAYENYYTLNGTTYESVVPAFTTNTYYKYESETYTVLSSRPADWDTNYTDYFKKTGDETYVAVTASDVIPTFAENTYYAMIDDGLLINAFNNSSLNKLIENGVLDKAYLDGVTTVYPDNAVAFLRADGTVDIANLHIDSSGNLVKVFLNENPGDVLSVIDFTSKKNSGNIIGVKPTDAAYTRAGSTVVVVDQKANGVAPSKIYVNGYDIEAVKDDYQNITGSKGTKIYIPKNDITNTYGVTPDSVNVDSDLLGHQYDTIIYKYETLSDSDNTIKAVRKSTSSVSYLYYDESITSTELTGKSKFTPVIDQKVAVGTKLYYNKAEATGVYYPAGSIVAEVIDIDNIEVVNNVEVGTVKAIKITSSTFTYTGSGQSIFSNVGTDSEGVELHVEGSESAVIKLMIAVSDLNVTKVENTVEVEGDNGTVTIIISPVDIVRYTVTGSTGSLIRPQFESSSIPENYYLGTFGVNPSSESGGVKLAKGSTGFFDDTDISDIEFKWRYSELLVKAFRGEIDPRIMSPVRCPAKFLFDGAFNTIVGQAILPNINYKPYDIVNSATIFTEEEKEEVLYNPDIMSFVTTYNTTNDIDVKQAMYDLMIYRCYYGMPEDKRPIGPGFGLSVHFDAGITDYNTAMLINDSFKRRFNNPNASWDIGGYTSINGTTYTYTKWIVDNLIKHCKEESINKPFVMSYATIPSNEYVSFYPDLDVTDWDLRELLYESGGNAWVPDINGNLIRRSQRTMFADNETSDLLQESNMRTLSQLCYLLQNMIEDALYSYTDDGVLQTLTDKCNNKFSTWAGRLVDGLSISFVRDTNPLDGGDIVVCYCDVTFRGLFLRVPIIVNVNRRTS